MEKNLQQLINQMDNKHWLRLLVCLMPGLIMSKVASYEFAPVGLQIGASLVLLLGIAGYAFWGRIRNASADDESNSLDEATNEEYVESPHRSNLAPGRSLDQLKELHAACAGDFEEVLQLLRSEVALHPEQSLTAVIAEAHHRRTFLKNRSGSSMS